MSGAATVVHGRWQQVLHAMGFQVPVMGFVLRTSLAAFAAMALAYAMGLEHPHWAAMSVWASSQPMREHLLARSAYRVGGSVVGVACAVLLVWLGQGNLWVLAVGLSLWVGVCAFAGNLQRGYMVYGWMLAGYSAAMVVLLFDGVPRDIGAFAQDRVLTVLTGVLVALAVCWCLAPRRQASVLIGRSRQATAGAMELLAQALVSGQRPVSAQRAPVLSRLAEVEELLELYPEGSRTAARLVKALRWQQHHVLELMYQLAHAGPGVPVPLEGERDGGATAALGEHAVLAQALQALAVALHAPVEEAGNRVVLQTAWHQAMVACEAVVQVQTAAGGAPTPIMLPLYALLQEMRRVLRAEQYDLAGAGQAVGKGGLQLEPRMDLVPLHRDWVGARQAGMRAGGTVLVLGVVWAITQLSLVAFAMLGLSVMLLVFSSFENPQRTMAFVSRGQALGAGLALACQGLVWPLAASGWQMVWMVAPFALLGGLLIAHRRTTVGALDANMVMFILLAPHFPIEHSMLENVGMALAIVSGPVLAWCVYRWVYPTDAHQRMRTLAQMMLQELPALAQRLVDEGQPRLWFAVPEGLLAAPGGFWQARLHHRLLKLLRWADKTQYQHRANLPAFALALRSLPAVMLELQAWRRGSLPVSAALRRTERLAELALRRTAQWSVEDAGHNGSKVQDVWMALAQQGVLPVNLATDVQRAATEHWPVLERARSDLLAAKK